MMIDILYVKNGPPTNLTDKIAERTSKVHYQTYQSVHHQSGRQPIGFMFVPIAIMWDLCILVDIGLILDFVILNILL
jgi:hypothetical protein